MNSLIQWNLNGFYKKIIDLKLLVNNLKPSIICLQETNLKPNHNATMKNYQGYFKERQTNPNRASGGVAILVKNNIKSSPIPIISELEVIATKIQLHQEITICNIYLPDSMVFSYQQIINIIKQLPSPYIMVGDFNSRNTNWGCNHTDPRGKIIEKIIDDENITLLNNGTFTRHNSSKGTFSAIDLSLASPSISPYLSWEKQSAYPLQHKQMEPKKSKLDTIFRHSRQKSENQMLNNELNTDDIDTIVKQFTSIITEAAHKSIGKTITHPKKTPVPWWSKECNNAIKNYKKALNRYKKTKTIPDHINFKKAKALSRRIIKHQNIESWKKLINDLTPNTPIKEAWKKIRLIEGIQFNETPQTLTIGDKTYHSSLEKAEALAEIFEKNSSDENYSPEFRNSKSKNETDNPIVFSKDENHPINTPINVQELYDALYKCNSKNSTGHDEIPYIFIKQLPISAISILLKIFNLIWEKRTFPTPWKRAIIIPILKPNKDRHEVTSYRPISLICTLSKLLKKIVSKRLYWTLKHTNFISNQQFGFQRNKSTIDALTILTEDIYSAFNIKQHTKSRLNVIRAISNRTWGANSIIIMRTYKSLVLSVIDYGSVIYGAAPEAILKSLDPIHNQGIRLSIGAFKTSPIPNILCEANTPPLEIRRNMLTYKFALKRLADKNNAISPYLFNTSPPSLHLKKNQPISTRIKKWLDTTNTPLPKLLSPTPYIFPPWKMNLNTNTSMIQEIQNIEPSEIPKHFNYIILKNFCNHKIIYTDGSKSNVKTGLAIITDEETFKFSSLEINSIFTIEALAILKAIELTEQNWKNIKSFLIASDSLSSILAIQNQGTANEIIKNIQERASSLAPRSVTFMWIPAHKNIPGNEKADVAAKEAASTNINIPKLDLSSFKDTARNSLINSKKIHQRLWDQELNNKLHKIKPFLSPNPNPPSSTRRQQVIWTRMKIGHTNISHVHLMRRDSRPNCEFCNSAPISTAHLLLEYSNLSEQRKIFPHLTLRDILTNDCTFFSAGISDISSKKQSDTSCGCKNGRPKQYCNHFPSELLDLYILTSQHFDGNKQNTRERIILIGRSVMSLALFLHALRII
ncbi:hypothetical protein AGLY_017519 [Aphis glycines]|uniref:RNase H type-1 domain-containing protein n=1 Tax=Aphis glycines TaxID=307491 RepID=A0A6G0SVF0_APHGL|nr:hypothetical protein AGLY_017519 [Aphis glycines]